MKKRLPEYADAAATPTRSSRAALVGVGHLDLAGCLALGITGPVLRSTGYAWDLRKSAALLRLRGLRLRGPDPGHAPTPTAGSGSGSTRCGESLQDRRAVPSTGSPASRARPVMVGDKKIAWPSQLAIGSDGMGNSLDHIRAHHGRVDGGADPPLQAGHRGLPGPGRARPTSPVESPRGELGAPRGLRRRHPPVPGALPRPVASPTCRPPRVMSEGGMVADVIVADRLDRPRHGRCRPLMSRTRSRPLGTARCPRPRSPATRRRCAELRRSPPATRRRGPALLPMLHLVQSVEGHVTARGHRGRAPRSWTSPPPRSSGVATFYTMYKRQPDRRLPRRRLHQHAVRGHGRRRDLRAGSRSTSTSATTRRPRTARSPSSTSSATPPATTPRS